MSWEIERDLVLRCKKGEAEAWNAVFEAHYAATGRFVFQLAPDFSREDAEEICQETFLSAIQNISTFRCNSQIRTWLFRIAVNKARDFRQKRQAAKRGGGRETISLQAEHGEDGHPLDVASNAPGPDGVLLSAERMRLLDMALQKLGETCRDVIEMRYFGDLSYEQVGLALGLNAKTVSSRLSKCLDRLEQLAKGVFSRENSMESPSNQQN